MGVLLMKRVISGIGLAICLTALGWSCGQQPATQEQVVSETTRETTILPEDAGTQDVSPQDTLASKGCVSARECPGQSCRNGKCVASEECVGHNDCKTDEFCFEDKTGERCAVRCEVDTDCPKEHVCSEGQCHQPQWLKGKMPNEGSTKNAPLQAGVGVAEMDFPLGVSMAGFGFRPGPRGPYARSLGGSTGMYDRFAVKALILDDGIERVVLLRSPLVFTTDFLLTQINQKVVKATGLDLVSKILMVSHHSHSAPARFWNLLTNLGFGAFGGGDFMAEVFDRLAQSFANAIIEANKNLAPAKIGYSIDRNFDPQNQIFSDRRSMSVNFKNPHLLVLRVDKMDGTPLAVTVTFPMHGTISENTMLTNDAGGGLEFQLQDYLEAKFKKRVEVFFMQGSAGDVSPRGDGLGHKSTHQMQMLGYLASQHIGPIYEKIQMHSDVTLEIANKRLPISRKTIGYGPDEFFRMHQGEKQAHRYGAFQCVKDGYNANDAKQHKDGDLGCAFSVFDLNGAPVTQFSKTRLTALRVGELFLSSFPGEVTSVLAKALVDLVAQESNGKIKDHIVVGYAQDHHLYLLTEDDWYKGGYEASMSVWGPKFGNYLLKEAKDLVLQLLTPEKEPNDTGILPQDFYQLDLTKIEVERLKSPDAGKVVNQPPKQYQRMDKRLTFTTTGGFYGTDMPRAILQRKESDNSFKDVMLHGVRPYDDSGHRMIMEFAQVKTSFHYTFAFEELEDFPVGTYRFRVEGTQWDGSKRIPYTVETEPFDIVPSTALKFWNPTLTGDTVTGWVSYPSATNDDGKSAFRLEPSGHRLRSPLVSWRVGPPLPEKQPVDLAVVIAQNGKTVAEVKATTLDQYKVVKQEVVESRDDKGNESKRSVDALASGFQLALPQKLAAGEYDVTLSIKDVHGNTGTWSNKLTVK